MTTTLDEVGEAAKLTSPSEESQDAQRCRPGYPNCSAVPFGLFGDRRGESRKRRGTVDGAKRSKKKKTGDEADDGVELGTPPFAR